MIRFGYGIVATYNKHPEYMDNITINITIHKNKHSLHSSTTSIR